jgi:hypothetical protein
MRISIYQDNTVAFNSTPKSGKMWFPPGTLNQIVFAYLAIFYGKGTKKVSLHGQLKQ